MALGRKTGGRKKGSRNRENLSATVEEMCRQHGHNPFEATILIATNPKATLDLRLAANAKLMRYVKPELAQMTHVGDQAKPICIVVKSVLDEPDDVA